MLFLKFGKKEHLQQLKDGIVHFRPLSSFVEDATCFRGDRLEGRLLIDLSHPFLVNGVDFRPYVKEVISSYVGLESILSFSAAMLDYNNCHATEDGLFTPNDDFIAEMQQFGSYFLVFSADDFILAINEAIQGRKAHYMYRPICYCDKTDSPGVTKYFETIRNQGTTPRPYDNCFLKDRTPYFKQNEWRVIIDDIANEFPVGDNGGVNIQTAFRTAMPIFETPLLKTLFMSEEYLK